jgi:hypothetical protein
LRGADEGTRTLDLRLTDLMFAGLVTIALLGVVETLFGALGRRTVVK